MIRYLIPILFVFSTEAHAISLQYLPPIDEEFCSTVKCKVVVRHVMDAGSKQLGYHGLVIRVESFVNNYTLKTTDKIFTKLGIKKQVAIAVYFYASYNSRSIAFPLFKKRWTVTTNSVTINFNI